MMIIAKSFRLILVALTASVFLLAAGCGGGSGSGDGDDGFPTPRLPADAVTFDVDNADEIAEAAVDFMDTLDMLAELKTEASPSMPQVARQVTDQIMRKLRISSAVAARTENIGEDLCDPGKATATFDESGSNESGSVTFTECYIGSDFVINGSFAYVSNWDDTNLDYSFRVDGELTLKISNESITESITIVMNLSESGNDDTGDFSSSVNFSLSGIPDSAFLVTTEQPWVGNVFSGEVSSGQLIVHGGDNTLLRITVIPVNTATVELDEGSGFEQRSPIML